VLSLASRGQATAYVYTSKRDPPPEDAARAHSFVFLLHSNAEKVKCCLIHMGNWVTSRLSARSGFLATCPRAQIGDHPARSSPIST